MEVYLAAAIRNLPGRPRPLVDLYREFVELGVLCEELGLDAVLLSEHHMAVDNWNPSPFLPLAALAARTSKIRLGTFVCLLPLHHPLRIAEDIATLDLLSNGRFDFIVGAGPMDVECQAYGISRSEGFGRTYEALEVIQRLLTEESVTHHGKYYHFDDVAMTTRPVQKPHPPLYTTPLMGPQSLEKSAQRGYHIASALHHPRWKDYVGLLQKYGRSRKQARIISGPVFVHLAESREQAFDEAEEGMHWAIDFYVQRGLPFPLAPLGEFRKPGNAIAYGVPIAAGTPEDVLKVLSQFRDDPMDGLSIQFAHPGLHPQIVERSLRTFAQEVLPEIRRWGI